ncbi:response regulator [Paenibacillus puerhi]|uniref:response regulator n=1 Tax=Paenibacillus puerhi TaxID=2692622 RepID=UPI0013567A9C|nr:response regulator [Paenibacillus puerhi]
MIKAILIDDEEIALDVLEILLEEIGGVTVLGRFLRADEALEQVARLQPDLIFLDIEMPGLHGLAAAEQLQQRCSEADIVFVTAYKEYALHAFDLYARGYLMKPVSKDRLATFISRYRPSRMARAVPAPETDPKPDGAESPGCEPPLKLNALGSLELYTAKGELLSWRTRKTKELFAYLWHHDGMPVYRHHILDALWPELSADRAQALFHTTMYHLRHMLKAVGCHEMVVFTDERYMLRVESIASDVKRLESKLRDAEEAEVEELLALYRGDYFETEYYRWAEGRRDELRAAYVQALERALNHAQGPRREALLRKLIELEPYANMHYYRLLLHLDAAGNGGAVLKLIDRLQQQVSEELGPEVTPAMQTLMQRYRKP